MESQYIVILGSEENIFRITLIRLKNGLSLSFSQKPLFMFNITNLNLELIMFLNY